MMTQQMDLANEKHDHSSAKPPTHLSSMEPMQPSLILRHKRRVFPLSSIKAIDHQRQYLLSQPSDQTFRSSRLTPAVLAAFGPLPTEEVLPRALPLSTRSTSA